MKTATKAVPIRHFLYLIMWLLVSHRNPRIVAWVDRGRWSGAVRICQSTCLTWWFTYCQGWKPDIPSPPPRRCHATNKFRYRAHRSQAGKILFHSTFL